jgi:hypothetical protein
MNFGRWPIHPAPFPGEALLSWLGRIAQSYGQTAADLLTHDLGVEASGHENLDVAAPPRMIPVLSNKTGQSVDRISRMTIAGSAPNVLDMRPLRVPWRRHRSGRRRTFVHATCVEIGLFDRIHACRVCLAETRTPWIRLAWRVPWIGSCPDHGLLLERASISPGCFAFWDAPEPRMASEKVRAIDRLSMAALEGEHPPTDREEHSGSRWFATLINALEELRTSFGEGLLGNPDTADGSLSDAAIKRLAAHPFELLSRQDQVRMLELLADQGVEVQSPSNKSAIHFER